MLLNVRMKTKNKIDEYVTCFVKSFFSALLFLAFYCVTGEWRIPQTCDAIKLTQNHIHIEGYTEMYI